MQHYAAFHLGLHCFQKYFFLGFPEYKGLNTALSTLLLQNETVFISPCKIFITRIAVMFIGCVTQSNVFKQKFKRNSASKF